MSDPLGGDAPQRAHAAAAGADEGTTAERRTAADGIAAKRCCCDHITLYLSKVKVTTRTDAPGPPGIAQLFGLVDDRVAVRGKSCDGATAIWPHDAPGQKVEAGEPGVTPDAPLATIKPSGQCYVSCSVQINVFRASRVNDILDALNALLPDLLAAGAAVATAEATAAAAAAAATASTASASAAGLAQAALSTAKDHFKEISDKITALEKALLGSNEALMGEFFVNFDGSLHCDDKLIDAVKNTSGAARGTDDDEVTCTRVLHNHGGVWEVTLTARKSCPDRKK